jgi:hypothetical protein
MSGENLNYVPKEGQVREGVWDLGGLEGVDGPSAAFMHRLPLGCRSSLEEILARHGRTIDDWIGAIDESNQALELRPWALVLFDRECPLMNYLLSTRADFDDYMGLSYTVSPGARNVDNASPLAGVLVIKKECLRPLYGGDEPYETIWSKIGNLDPKRQWLCLARLPESVPYACLDFELAKAYRDLRLGKEMSRPPAWNHHPILEAVRSVFERGLSVDREWALLEDAGFFWWPQGHRQEIRAQIGYEGLMGRVCRLEAKTDFVSQVGKINGKLIEGINSVNARAASGSALVLDPLAHSLKLVFQCCLVDGELDWAPAIFAFYAMLQAVEAHEIAGRFARNFGGVEWTSPHPWSGARPGPAALLLGRETKVLPAGQGPCLWLGADDRAVLRERYGGGDHAILENSDLVVVQETLGPGCPGGLELVRTEHPVLGIGLSVGLRVPIQGPLSSIEVACADLNHWAYRIRVAPMIPGAWCADQMPEEHSDNGERASAEGARDAMRSREAMPVFRLFLPNCLYQPGLLGKLLPILDSLPRSAGHFFIKQGYM